MKPADVARARARALLDEFRVRSAPVPVERIIKGKNIRLQVAPLSEDLSGMAYIKDGLAMIGINALHHPNRQRFSAAHELGHHMLHAEHITDTVHVDKGNRALFRNEMSSLGIDVLEVQANAFAAELLMPAKLLSAALEDSGIDLDDERQVAALARKFNVSMTAMSNRLALLLQEQIGYRQSLVFALQT